MAIKTSTVVLLLALLCGGQAFALQSADASSECPDRK